MPTDEKEGTLWAIEDNECFVLTCPRCDEWWHIFHVSGPKGIGGKFRCTGCAYVFIATSNLMKFRCIVSTPDPKDCRPGKLVGPDRLSDRGLRHAS